MQRHIPPEMVEHFTMLYKTEVSRLEAAGKSNAEISAHMEQWHRHWLRQQPIDWLSVCLLTAVVLSFVAAAVAALVAAVWAVGGT